VGHESRCKICFRSPAVLSSRGTRAYVERCSWGVSPLEQAAANPSALKTALMCRRRRSGSYLPIMRVDVFGFLCSLLSGSCRHRRYTFPMSSRRESSAASAGTRAPAYVVCLDCAKRFPYDWEQMRVIWTPEPSAIPTGANAEPLGSGMPAFPADGVRETVALASPSTTLSSKVSSWIWMLRRQRLPARLRSLLRTSLRWRVSH
jgi:hypothetical protein